MSPSLALTVNHEQARRILNHPRLRNSFSDDFCGATLELSPQAFYLVAEHEGKSIGLWAFEFHNSVWWEVHTCFLPEAWGAPAKKAAAEMLGWLWSQTSCQRLTAAIPAFNRLAIRFAEANGMTKFGLNEKAYMKNGTLHDLVMLGMNRPREAVCQ